MGDFQKNEFTPPLCPGDDDGDLNAPLSEAIPLVAGDAGSCTTEIGSTYGTAAYGDLSNNRTTGAALTLRLKSGGTLDLTWARLISKGGDSVYAAGQAWQPAGAGAVFSFLPYASTYQTSFELTWESTGATIYPING